jgi:glycine oxidase
LVAACRKRGVEISAGVEAFDFEISGERIVAVQTNAGSIPAERVLLACGAWSRTLASRLGIDLPIKPIRGQIVLLNCGQPMLSRVINAGRLYLLPRDDGRILVGSTQEDVGFDRRNTAAAISDLLQFAARLAPELRNADIERCWSGFRPRGVDDLPYLGRLPGLSNAFIAAGHFRHGVWLAPGTAVVLRRLIRGEAPGVDLTPFRLDRPAVTPA